MQIIEKTEKKKLSLKLILFKASAGISAEKFKSGQNINSGKYLTV